MTCRQYVSWAFALMGGFASIGYSTETVYHKWYEVADELDNEQVKFVCDPTNRYSFDYSNEAITISGLFYKDSDQSTTLVGQPDYTIDFTSNPLTSKLYSWDASASAYQLYDPYNVLVNIYNYRSGNVLSYTPFSATVRAAPFLWPGDPVELVNYMIIGYDEDGDPIWGEEHWGSTITHVTYKLNGATYIEAKGQSVEAHQTVPTSGSGSATGSNILAGDLTVTGTASFSGNIAVPNAGLLKVITVTTNTVSISGTSTGTLSATASPGAGWTPLGIVGYNLSRGVGFVFRAVMSNAGNIDFRVYNTTNSTISLYGTVYVLCVRTSL